MAWIGRVFILGCTLVATACVGSDPSPADEESGSETDSGGGSGGETDSDGGSGGETDSDDGSGGSTAGEEVDCSALGEGSAFAIEPELDVSVTANCVVDEVVRSDGEARFELACDGELASLEAVTLFTPWTVEEGFSEFELTLRVEGEQRWIRATGADAMLFGAAEAQTLTPEEEPDFFARAELRTVSLGCEPSACDGGGTGPVPVGLAGQSKNDFGETTTYDIVPGEGGGVGQHPTGGPYVAQLHEGWEGNCGSAGPPSWFSVAISFEYHV